MHRERHRIRVQDRRSLQAPSVADLRGCISSPFPMTPVRPREAPRMSLPSDRCSTRQPGFLLLHRDTALAFGRIMTVRSDTGLLASVENLRRVPPVCGLQHGGRASRMMPSTIRDRPRAFLYMGANSPGSCSPVPDNVVGGAMAFRVTVGPGPLCSRRIQARRLGSSGRQVTPPHRRRRLPLRASAR